MTGAESIRWDLSELYLSLDDPQLALDMQKTHQMADAIADTYKGRVASLRARELLKLLSDYEVLETLLMKINSYIVINYTVDREDPERGKMDVKNDVHQAEVRQKVAFFKLEWTTISDDRVSHLLEDSLLGNYRHYLEVMRLETPHQLSEREEDIFQQASLANTWPRYFEEWKARLHYLFEGQELTEAEISRLGGTADRTLKQRLDTIVGDVKSSNLHTPTYIYNMFLLDKATKDKIRNYPSWLSEYNLANQVEDRTVDTLIQAVTKRYDIAHRYYRLLKRYFGYEELFTYDLFTPFEQSDQFFSWHEASETVLSAFKRFDTRLAETAKLFFDKQWIDAPPAPGKDFAGYCTSATSSVHPYIFLNYQGGRRDVMTLAHELGHGIHYLLSREQGQLNYESPNVLSETASTFCQMLLLNHQLEVESDSKTRFVLRLEQLRSTLLSVHVSIARTCFEDAIHTAYREEGELSTEQITELWIEVMTSLQGDAVSLTDSSRLGWLLNTYFVSFPGYQYSYAFGELVVWSIFAQYIKNPEGFADRYLDTLRAGGSNYPHKILEPLGVDINDEDFWMHGLELIDEQLIQLEREIHLYAKPI